jgi:Fe-S-cluster containining protein
MRRFACTACGACCNRGPEVELGEATALADVFVTQLLFKVHSLPLYPRSRRAAQWAELQRSRLPAEQALEEERDLLRRIAVRERIDKAKGRSLHLAISALTLDREAGKCPALVERRCSIYASRPQACRTVPLHYSRPASVLGGYLDRFVATPGFECNVSPDAPVVLNGCAIVDASALQARDDALSSVDAERPWKAAIAAVMDDARSAAAADLPTFDDVLRQSDAGYATLAPMLAAWRIGRDLGVLSRDMFADACRRQAALIRAELDRGPDLEAAGRLMGLLADCEREARGVLAADVPVSAHGATFNLLKSR